MCLYDIVHACMRHVCVCMCVYVRLHISSVSATFFPLILYTDE